MARAAAPMLLGLRAPTRTTVRRARAAMESMYRLYGTGKRKRLTSCQPLWGWCAGPANASPRGVPHGPPERDATLDEQPEQGGPPERCGSAREPHDFRHRGMHEPQPADRQRGPHAEQRWG